MILTYEFLANWMRARFADSERGASLVEYALLVALIAVVCIAAVAFLGRSGSSKLGDAGNEINGTSGICYNDGAGGHFYYDPGTGTSGPSSAGTCP